jgi:hypothetical protein
MPLIPIAEMIGDYGIRYTWAGTAPYDVWLNGALRLSSSTETTLVVDFPNETTPPAIEVRDATDTGEALSLKHSPRLRLQWRGARDALLYRIERWSGTAWVVKQIANETAQGYYSFLTLPEEDGATVQYQIVAVDGRDHEGEVIQHTQTMACVPSPPAVEYSYDDGTGLLTVAAPS